MVGKLLRGLLSRAEGQSLVLVALASPVLLGFVGLSIDFGRLATEQRKLQNYADSAALAGAQDLSSYYSQACTDAGTSLTKNSNPASVSCAVSKTTNANDTIAVTLSESVPLDFLPVLGVSSKSVSATGKAITSSVTGCSDTTTTICAPYAAWRPSAPSSCPDQFIAGMTIIFRDNGWSGDTGAGSCSTWSVNSNDFKGFLRPTGSDIYVGNDTITTKGGNACGQEPTADIQAAATAHQDLVIPVLDSGSGNGNTTVHVPGFVTVSLNFTYPYTNQLQSVVLEGSPTGGTFTLTYGSKTTAAIPYDGTPATVTLSGSPTGGTYTLSYGVQTTVAIAYNATAATVQSDLQSLSSVGSGNISVQGSAGGPYTLALTGTLSGGSLGSLAVQGNSLTGGTSPSIAVATTTMPAFAQAALQQLSSIGTGLGDVTVTGSNASGGWQYLLDFGGSMTMSSLGTVTATSSLSGGSSPSVAVSQTETNSSAAGTASQSSDYTCPATWYGMVVSTATSAATLSGVDGGGACSSTFYSCQIRLQQ